LAALLDEGFPQDIHPLDITLAGEVVDGQAPQFAFRISREK
jgi:hypothetical protein